ncbi:MAG: helix-turn-helix transcriptional regulator [Actinomycetota bacterium]
MAKKDGSSDSNDRAVYIISVAAELAGVHPQTLRFYERKGLVQPARSSGNTRRYSERDIARLRTIQRLTQDQGVNLAGAKMVIEMQKELERMREKMLRMQRDLDQAKRRGRKTTTGTELVPLRSLRTFPWEGVS